ncbi:MAG: HAMP domain-containing histidine kinase [Parasporobacterium sp.]|nr:HAMP domain-containing histidine kinase [Parasporobacterium sp.]
MRSSIQRKIIALLLAFVIILVFISYAANFLIVKEYYYYQRQNSFEKIYNNINSLAGNSDEISEKVNDRLCSLCETEGITLLIFAPNGEVIFDYGNESQLKERYEKTINNENDNAYSHDIIKTTDNYAFQSYQETSDDTSYFEMWGKLSGGNNFILRMVAQASSTTGFAYNNRAYFLTTLLMITLVILMFYLFSLYFTRPIRNLSDISQKMMDDDFEAKYTGKRRDEIDVLGKNMNELSEKLKNTIAELKSANLELQKDIDKKTQIDEQRKEFLSNVSHELKTPIALIQGYAEGLKEDIYDDAESRDYYCDVIIDESKRMNNIVKKLLSLNQIEFGNYHVVMERFDICQVISGVLNSSMILIKQKNIKLSYDCDKSVYVWADEFQIEEVINNFVSNAINHVSGENEIKIDIITDNPEVARINVFNSGNHIPEESLEHLWDKFYKVDKARTREYGGSGLGLSIVKAIMESMNQKYGVENVEGGVVFWFELECKN